MKKNIFFAASLAASIGLLNAQSYNAASEIPNTVNNPQVRVELPAAYFNSTTSAVAEVSNEGIIATPLDLSTPIPFTGTFGNDANNATQGIIYDNGSVRNEEDTPPYWFSIVQDSSLDMSTFGFGTNNQNAQAIADDFIIRTFSEIDFFVFFAYQTGTITPSIDKVFVEIWDGDPSGNGTKIWGDLTTNRLLNNEMYDTHRVLESNQTNTTRPIQFIHADTAGLSLSAGTYWVVYSLEGTGGSGPWTPPVTITNQMVTGNALQFVDNAWNPLIDNGNSAPQGLPFAISGTEIGGEVDCLQYVLNDYSFMDGVNMATNSQFRVANDITIPAGESLTLNSMTISLMANNGITNVDVIYFDDNAGLPGNQIGSENSLNIVSQKVIGENNLLDINEVEVNVTPFLLNGQTSAPTTYWIELRASNGSNNNDVYWSITDSSMNGLPTATVIYQGWQYQNPDYDGVYIFEGQCDAMLGVADQDLVKFNYYPNPTNGMMNISADKNIEAVAVYNMLGQKVYESKVNAISSQFDMSRFAAGTYMMKVTIDGITKTHKILKK